jgi:hypothetical protein
MSIWDRLWELIRSLFGEIMLNIDNSLRPENAETRIRRLRYLYYDDPKADMTYRRVKEVVREYVDPAYYGYYERIFSAERAAYQMSRTLHKGTRANELLAQMQELSAKIILLVEQLQNADKIAKLYPADSPNAASVAESRGWLVERIEQALAIHGSIPAKMMSFQTTTAGRGIDKFNERIARLTERLDDIAESYADLDGSPDYQRELMNDDDEDLFLLRNDQ